MSTPTEFPPAAPTRSVPAQAVACEPVTPGTTPSGSTAAGPAATGALRIEAAGLADARRILALRGWVVIPGAGFTDGRAVDPDQVRRLASLFGVPSARDGGETVWPIRPGTSDRAATFSQRDGEALLHTDAAYRADPEPLFALFCVRPADDGGLTRVLTAADAARATGPELYAPLSRPVWRWTPPRVFGGPRDEARPIFDHAGGVRWRLDNLDAPPRLLDVGRRFSALVEQSPLVAQFPLAADAVLVCDNRRCLHGRTTFADPRRLLFRVRLVSR